MKELDSISKWDDFKWAEASGVADSAKQPCSLAPDARLVAQSSAHELLLSALTAVPGGKTIQQNAPLARFDTTITPRIH